MPAFAPALVPNLSWFCFRASEHVWRAGAAGGSLASPWSLLSGQWAYSFSAMCRRRAIHPGSGVPLLSVTLFDDVASSGLTMGFGGVVGTVTWWSSVVTAVIFSGWLPVLGRAPLRSAHARWVDGEAS